MPIYDQRGQRVGIQINVAGDFIVPAGAINGVPIQRPPYIDNFTNREHELDQILASLGPGKIVTLCGPGGVGKTALMSRAVRTLAPDDTPPSIFPDGIIFHNFSTYNEIEDVLIHITSSYGEDAKPTPLQAVQRILSNKKALLILDGTEQIDDWSHQKETWFRLTLQNVERFCKLFSGRFTKSPFKVSSWFARFLNHTQEENLWSLLDIVGDCGVLITSQSRADASAIRLDIEPLSIGEAIQLLKAWGGIRANDVESVEQICQLVGGLPLAVKIAGRYMEQQEEDAAEYLASLKANPLTALDQGINKSLSVRGNLERSIARLSSLAQQSLAVIGRMPFVSFEATTIAIFLGVPEKQVSQPLGELVKYNLLKRKEQRYKCSPLVYEYAGQYMGERSTRANVLHIISRSVNRLGSHARQTLGLLSKMPLAPYEAEIIAKELHTSELEVKRTLDELVRYNLLSQENQFYECHPLIHEYAKIELSKEAPAVNAFSYTNAKGQTYYLHTKEVTLKDGRVQRIYYFARDIRDGALEAVPSGYEVMETKRTNMPVLKRSR